MKRASPLSDANISIIAGITAKDCYYRSRSYVLHSIILACQKRLPLSLLSYHLTKRGLPPKLHQALRKTGGDMEEIPRMLFHLGFLTPVLRTRTSIRILFALSPTTQNPQAVVQSSGRSNEIFPNLSKHIVASCKILQTGFVFRCF